MGGEEKRRDADPSALKQTAASADRRRALHTGDEASLIDLGTFVDCLHGHDRKTRLGFTLEWSASDGLDVRDPIGRKRYTGHALRLVSELAANAQDQPVARRVHYELREGDRPVLTADLTHADDGKVELEANPYRLVHAQGRKWPVEPAEKFYRISDKSLSRYQNADFLAEFAVSVEQNLGSLSYLGPLRDYPRRL
jgi:hypothetical protein